MKTKQRIMNFNTRNLLRKTSRSALATALIAIAPAFAQIPPDAGQTLRELRQPQDRNQPSRRDIPSLTIDSRERGDADDGTRFLVSEFRVTGGEHFSPSELEDLVADLAGAELTLAELQAAAARITNHYRAHGFAVARAYLPAQEIVQGVVTIAVLEGTLGDHELENQSLVADARLNAVVAAANPQGEPIRSASVDRALLILSDMPGVARVAGSLSPGERVGTSNFVVSARPGKRIDGGASIDNFGNRFTGQLRASAWAYINSPLRIGDRLTLQTTVSEEELAYGSVAWDAPVGDDGLRLGAAFTSSRYELGEDFASLEAGGTSHAARLYARYPLRRGLQRNIWLGANVERRYLEDRIDSIDTETDKTTDLAEINISGDLTDRFAGGGVNRWRVSGTFGDLSIDTPAQLEIDQLGARTDGTYQRWLASVSRLQTVTERTSLYLSATGQLANKNLDSSEAFSLGGAYGLRAYPQGEAGGDEGWIATAELRHRIFANLQASLFYDAGGVTIDHDRYGEGTNSRSLSGYGLGLLAQWERLTLQIDIAWRSDEAPTSDRDRSPRIWARTGWRF